jgi:MFS family permease
MIIPLVATAVFINYVDRGNLATAAPLIKDELRLSASQLGVLISAFSWTYVAATPLAGWLSERIGAHRAMTLGLMIWSVATLVTGLAAQFEMLLALRLVLGLGESVAFPCASKLIAERVAPEKLGGANALVSLGMSLGPAFGVFFGGLLMARFGWREVFLVFGAVSLTWLAPWIAASRGMEAARSGRPEILPPGFLAILGRRELWGAALGHFGAAYPFYFITAWLPLYLVKARGYSVAGMAGIGGAAYLVYGAAALASGLVSDRWMAAGASATRVRKTLAVASHLGTAAALFLCTAPGASISLVGLFLAVTFAGLVNPQVYAIGQRLAGPRAAGKWMGVQNCVANVSGVVGPLATGVIIDRAGGFEGAFALSAAVSLAGVVGWTLLIPKIEPVDWREPGT